MHSSHWFWLACLTVVLGTPACASDDATNPAQPDTHTAEVAAPDTIEAGDAEPHDTGPVDDVSTDGETVSDEVEHTSSELCDASPCPEWEDDTHEPDAESVIRRQIRSPPPPTRWHEVQEPEQCRTNPRALSPAEHEER